MNNKPFPYAFFQGKTVPIEEAKVSVMTHALQYGTAVFGGIRGYVSENKAVHIFRISDHYHRFLNALRILNVHFPYTVDKLVHITLDLAKKNNPQTDCYIRPLAYASNLGISPDFNKATFDFLMYMIPLGEYLPLSRGLRLAVSNWVRISDTMIPARGKVSGSYANSSLAKGDAARLGFDDALMLNQSGHIAEASASNLFIVRDNTLITSPENADILEGITRKSILQLARDLGISIKEREIDRTEIYIADEAFLCGTGVQIAWIAGVDGRSIGAAQIGPITHKIQALFFDAVRAKEKKYSSWLTAI